MLALLPLNKPITFLDGRFARRTLFARRQPKTDNRLGGLLGRGPAVPIESRLPRDHEDPCSFRTRLIDPMTDSDVDLTFETVDKQHGTDLRFDDSQCISVGRSMNKFKSAPKVAAREDEQPYEQTHMVCGGDPSIDSFRNTEGYDSVGPVPVGIERAIIQSPEERPDRLSMIKTLSETTTICEPTLDDQNDGRFSKCSHSDDGDEEEETMEVMNLPFWQLPKRQKRTVHHSGDVTPDDMSIISDASLVPTYFPSDMTKQQRPQHRVLLKRLVRAKARAARQTMRDLKRSCRNVVGNVFVDSATPKPVKCVAVGAV